MSLPALELLSICFGWRKAKNRERELVNVVRIHVIRAFPNKWGTGSEYLDGKLEHFMILFGNLIFISIQIIFK